MAEVQFNIWDPEFRANPYPYYGPLFAGPPPILNLGPMTFVLVARYADVTAGLRDHEHLSSVQPPPPPDQIYEGRFKGARNMLGSDPPQHSRLRRLVSRDFTPRRIRELEPRIRQIAKEQLDKVEAKGSFDVMADLANVLPVTVIAEMLGVPPELNAQFKHWSDTLISGDNNIPGTPPSPLIVKTVDELGDYFTAEIERRRKNPGSDLVSALVAAHDEGDVMSSADLLSFVLLLLIAGNETTTNLIGNGTLALGRHPDQMARLRQKPELMPRAIDEMLRYDGPVQSTFRTAICDTNVGGTDIKTGTGVFVMVAAANRDPAHFPDPDRFDITRDPNDHVAFGEGIHFCLGSGLAKVEGSIAIATMLARFPGLRLANPEAPLKYKGSYFLRGLAQLEMAID